MPKRTSRRQILEHCQEIGPEDGVDPRESIRRALIEKATQPKLDRKALQLCRQVERTLAFVLSGELNDDRIRDLQIMSVVPAPHTNHLLATLQSCVPLEQDELIELDAALASHKSRVRAAMAADINRRKTPDITMRVVNPS